MLLILLGINLMLLVAQVVYGLLWMPLIIIAINLIILGGMF